MISHSALLFSALTLLSFSQIAFTIVVPPYMKICGRRNPNLDQCVIDSVHHLRPILKLGIPELGVPPLEPLVIDEVTLAELDNFKAIAKPLKLNGLTDFNVTYLKVQMDKLKIDLEVFFPNVIMNSNYEVDAKILVPIKDKGPIKTHSKDVIAKVALKLTKTERKGKEYVFFTNMQMKLILKDYEATFKPGIKNPVSEAINSVLQNSRQEIIESMTPNLEKSVSTKILEMANRICKNFSYDELFPDRP